jgi:hypothetical protein
MPRLWELTTPQGKEALKRKARELGMFNFNPDDGYKRLIEAPLEKPEEIDRLMREKPGFEKE